MSIENAILEHAAAMREVAAAIRERSAPLGDLARQAQSAIADITATVTPGGGPLVVEQVEQAKASTKNEQAAEVKPDAEREQAVAKVEADAKKPAGGAPQTDTSVGAGSVTEKADAAPLDYAKDVQPKLLAFIKANGKEAFVKLLSEKFGVSKAPDLKAEQYPAVLAAIAA